MLATQNNDSASAKQKSAEQISTRTEVAKLAGVSHDTIDKTEKILSNGTQDQIQRARQGGKGKSRKKGCGQG